MDCAGSWKFCKWLQVSETVTPKLSQRTHHTVKMKLKDIVLPK